MMRWKMSDKIFIDKTEVTTEWKKILFIKGIYKIIPSKENVITMKVGCCSEAKVYIDKCYVLEVTELEQWFEFKSDLPNEYFYRYDLNEVANFIEIVEQYRSEAEELKELVEGQLTTKINKNENDIGEIINSVRLTKEDLKQIATASVDFNEFKLNIQNW